MRLQDLYQKLEGQTSLRLADLFPAVKNIGGIFPALGKAVPLVIDDIAVKCDKPGDDMTSVTVSGQTASFAAFESAEAAVEFVQEADDLGAALDVHLGGAITFPGVSWFGMRDVDLKASMAGGESPLTGEIRGELTAAPGFRFALQTPTMQNQWRIHGKFDDPSVPSIANFFQLIGGIDLFALLPPPFDTFSDLGLRQMDIAYDATGKEIVCINMIMQTGQPWTLLPRLAVSNILLPCRIDHPGDRQNRAVSFEITGDFSIGAPSANTLQVRASAPPLRAVAKLAEGEIQLGDALTLFMNDTLDLGAALSDFHMDINPAQKAYELEAEISADEWALDFGPTTLALTELGLHISSSGGEVSGGVHGKMHIGPDDGGVDLLASAERSDEDGGWVLSAGLEGTVPLVDLAATFLREIGGEGSVPDWVTAAQLDIRDVSFEAELPPKTQPGAGKTFTVEGGADWDFRYGSIHTALSADMKITYQSGAKDSAAQKTSGHIKGAADLFGLLVTLGYEFSPTDKSLFIEWEGIRGTYNKPAKGDETIALVLGDMSMGRMISLLMRTFDPDFQLAAPWNVLDSINFDGLSLVYNLTDKEIKVTYAHKIDLAFVTFNSLTLTKNAKGVLLSAEGIFLGQEIGSADDTSGLKDGRDVTELPDVPGAGSELFELHYLGLGQHVSLYPARTLPGVEEAAKALESVFGEPPSPKPGKPPILPIPVKPAAPDVPPVLIFNRDSNWLIGMRATIVKAITLSAIFNDPDLYGLLVEVGGDKFPQFKGLRFEILYKKVTDSIGVFHTELTLPEAMRQLELGVASVTLPVVGIDIYTNGNFKLDIGFPYNLDFSRSMTVQVFPFTGSGGFYFAYLNSATSSRVPVTTVGRFDPVIELGLGLQLGIGKDVSRGILKAGLSLTLIGMIEGVLGFYHPNQPGYPGKDEIYYWMQGTVGLVGHIYGEVDFSIISARVDLRVYAMIQVTIEAYNTIPIVLEAGISVSLKVRINLGLFSIKISLKFSTTIRASFVIGEDRRAEAPWNYIPAGPMAFALPAPAAPRLALNWQPLPLDDQQEELTLYFLPHLTLSGESGDQAAQYVAMLYIDSPEPGSTSGEDSSLHKLVKAVLTWVLNACDDGSNAGSVSLDTLRALQRHFSDPTQTESPLVYGDIMAFLRARFKPFRIIDPDTARQAGRTDLHATVFPMIPDLQLETALNGKTGVSVSFKTPQNVTASYQQQVRVIFQEMAVEYRSEAERAFDQAEFANISAPKQAGAVSMATAVFEDFFTLIARVTLQDAVDTFENNLFTEAGSASYGPDTLPIDTIVNAAVTDESVARISGMAARYLLHGLRLPDPDDMQTVAPLYALTGQQVAVPALKKDDRFVFILKKDPSLEWITFFDFPMPDTKALTATLDNSEISRVNALASIRLDPDVSPRPPQPLALDRTVQQTFSLNSAIEWQYPDNADIATPTIWQLSPALLHTLQHIPPGTDLALRLRVASQPRPNTPLQHADVSDYRWATLVRVTLRKIPPNPAVPILANTYEVIGADETGIAYLERLLRHLNTAGEGPVEQIHLLFRPSPTSGMLQGLQSEANGGYKMALVKGNLSTETHPVEAGPFALAFEAPPRNTLNTFTDFVALLWQCSIVRSGGFYLYYTVTEGAKGLPDHLFTRDNTGTISLLITYTSTAPAAFMNSAVIAQAIDPAASSLYAESGKLSTLVATVPPGHIGIEVERVCPADYAPVVPYPDPATAASMAQDRRYLEHQFNLLGYKLEDSDAIRGQAPALLPIGAMDTVEGEDVAHMAAVPLEGSDIWRYQVVIPVARYANNPIPSPHESDLPAAANPYAAVGGTAAVRLNWQDFFGNTIPTPQSERAIEADIRYTDPLIGISRWPGVSVQYAFPPKANGGEQIQLKFAFNPSHYRDSEGNMRGDHAQVDAETYRRLYYQLLPPEVEISVATTLDGHGSDPGAPVLVDKAQVLDYVAALYQYLHRIVSGNGAGPLPTPLTITQPVILSNPDHIFELVVALTIQRTRHVAARFAGAEGVGAITSTIPPLTGESSLSSQGSISLSRFAGQFEAMFKTAAGMMAKIAIGASKDDLDSTPHDKKVWVVRFDSQGKNGIDVRVEETAPGMPKQAFFAPIPLANSLETYADVVIKAYESGKPYPVADGDHTQTFANVNLDVWGRQFLDAVDEFLAPEYAVPTFLVDNGATLQAILDAKDTLAEAIVGTVDRILEEEDPSADVMDISSAQEKLKQHLLTRLSNAYAIEAVVQHPVSVASQFSGPNQEPAESAPYVPRLFGKLVCPGDTVQGDVYSLSAAKIPLGHGRSWLTYLFDARMTDRQSSYLFKNLAYQITHIEHQIESVPNMGDYRSSAWLSFVHPLRVPVPVGRVNVPVPLRSYPTTPSLVAQRMVYRQNGGPDQSTTIAEARQWDYEFTYEKAEASQDTIHTEIQLNIRPDEALAFGASDQIRLPQALAQFVSVYPQIRADFAGALVKTTLATDPTSTKFMKAKAAIQAFSTIVKTVAGAWSSWNQINPRGRVTSMAFGVSVPPSRIIYHYEIIEAPAVPGDAGTPLVITVNRAPDEPDSPLPVVMLDGYDLESSGHHYRYYQVDAAGVRTYLAFNDRSSVAHRRVILRDLDILDIQNAWAGVLIKRNEDLVQTPDGTYRTTNPRFIYQTPLVRFYNKLLPLLECHETIDLAAGSSASAKSPQPSSQPLAVHLSRLLASLLQNRDQNGFEVKLECSYRYTLGNAGAVTLPVLLVPPVELNPQGDSDVSLDCADTNNSFACQLSRKLLTWYNTHRPSPTGGAFVFRVEVYGYTDTRLPLLRLNTLTLDLATIKELVAAR